MGRSHGTVDTMPRVAIVVPVFNDESWIGKALDSCLAQTLTDIEVICVDDASTDGTCDVIRAYAARDARVRLIALPENRSAFQARRTGVAALSSPYVLFLDGDDELDPRAAEAAWNVAKREKADVVGFGVELVTEDGRRAPRFERSLQPVPGKLDAPNIVPALFPEGEPAQGHIWKYLFAAPLLTTAYLGFSEGDVFYRANDIPISYLAIASANRYVSIPDRLYRYNFRRGASGREATDEGEFRFFLGAIDSIEAIEERVRRLSLTRGKAVLDSYESARLSIVGNVLSYCVDKAPKALQPSLLGILRERVGAESLACAAAVFVPGALDLVGRECKRHGPERNPVRHVMITTGNLRTGGVQGVVVAQIRYLLDAGFSVTLALFSSSPVAYDLPPEVEVVRVPGGTRYERVRSWLSICRERSVDVVIDHHILYNDYWSGNAVAALSIGIPTVGWLHNFALRPILDFDDRNTSLVRALPSLQRVVVLSAVDVAYWKFRGIDQVSYLPNPPSPMALSLESTAIERTPPDGRVRIVWCGRLQQSTKQVRSLVELAVNLRTLGIDFELRIIGPDGSDLTARDLRAEIAKAGVADCATVVGPLHGDELVDALAASDVFVSTSIIEGYPLALIEAQLLGLPIVMFDLPWVSFLEGNDGIVRVPQGDVKEMARQIGLLAGGGDDYVLRSQAAVAAGHAALSHDFAALYSSLLQGKLPEEYSPNPTLADARILFDWDSFYFDRNIGRVRRSEARSRQRLRAARSENERLSRSSERLERRLSAISGSVSFRVGRSITAIPRGARNFLNGLEDRVRRRR